MHIVTTDCLALLPQLESHAAEMFAVLSDPAIYQYENGPPESLEWLRQRYARLESRISPDEDEIWLNWVIRIPTGQLIGYVQATIQPNGLAAIAYELHSDWWGQGLGRAAVQAMLTELADRYGIRHLLALVKRPNLRSQRLLAHLGFTLAPAAEHTRRGIGDDEFLLQWPAASPAAAADPA